MIARNEYCSRTIEWLRFICIVAVVLLHAVGKPVPGNEVISYKNGIYDTIRILFSEGLCRVAVPILFFISGYLFFVRLAEWNTHEWTNKLKRRIRSLLAPYLIWNIISICSAFLVVYLKSIITGAEITNPVTWFNSIGGFRLFWATKWGYPHNEPLWFIRDLMVFITLSPIIYCYIKKTGIIGLAILYLAYLFNYGIKLPGFSQEGLFYFAFGAYLSVREVDFSELFSRHYPLISFLALLIIPIMVLSYNNNPLLFGYTKRIFTLLGAISMTGIVASLIQKRNMELHPLLSRSSFFIYAAHGTIVLPIMQVIFSTILPNTQFGLIVQYFSAPLLTVSVLVLCYYYMSILMPKATTLLSGGRGTTYAK